MKAAGICEKGDVRRENQDAILMRLNGRSGLFMVADGVGGSGNGREASAYLTACFGQWWEEHFPAEAGRPFADLFDETKALAERVNEELYRRFGPGGGCTTMVLLFIHQGIFGYLSAGDSRVYRCSRKGARCLTRDDVWENQPDFHEDLSSRGKILSAVGGAEHLEYSCATERLLLRESFLLCSDGIYKFVEEAHILRQLARVSRSLFFDTDCAGALARAAVGNGTSDNYSAIVVKI